MKKSNSKRIEILKELEEIPSDRLQEIENFIKSILSQTTRKKIKEPKTLKGIWAGKGFEKIIDLENEIKSVRKEVQAQRIG